MLGHSLRTIFRAVVVLTLIFPPCVLNISVFQCFMAGRLRRHFPVHDPGFLCSSQEARSSPDFSILSGRNMPSSLLLKIILKPLSYVVLAYNPVIEGVFISFLNFHFMVEEMEAWREEATFFSMSGKDLW